MSNAPGEKPGQTGGKSDKSQQQPRKGDTGQPGKGGQQSNPTGTREQKQGGSNPQQNPQNPKGALPRYDDRPEKDEDEVEGSSEAGGEPRYGDRERDDPRRTQIEGKYPSGGEQRGNPTNR
jgi:hypothetical protein